MDLQEESLKLHLDNQGKMGICCKVPLKDGHDLAVAYTPGVAEPCKEIQKHPEMAYEYTARGNMVGICTDGTRVLGLGNIGAEAAFPVMEGKAVLFKRFADVDAIPVCISEPDPDKFVAIVKALEPTFAAINLEDIASPKCYDIEDRLKAEMHIPVFHDDQHGTAIAAVSAVIGALRFVKKDIKTARILMNGCGAAGSAIGRLLLTVGAENLIMLDSRGALYEGRNVGRPLDRVQEALAKATNKEKLKGSLKELAVGADVLIGASVAGAFTEEIIRSMASDAVVFGLANPVPEAMYEDAKAAGARVAGTGRSDAPNQVNNVNVFPGVFRGAIDVRATEINDAMKVAAVYAIANLIEDKDLREDYVVPSAFDRRVAPAVAAAVARAAMETGVARKTVDPEKVRANTEARLAQYCK
ncbi:MAG: NADP-dependent malic enzyme [Succiniclasticum sp.]|uniref:NAD(P)-dependent malic enzyme n=1 Tax=Succiniclasticum sp. TaxID=2775030 RepID=UPI002A91E1F3|nr:NADP-dependent malic enzyme [Succiniclasticum sp.]MDY6290671.1 NADP-dependent malic enzyme [Succiniclasticum sp.]